MMNAGARLALVANCPTESQPTGRRTVHIRLWIAAPAACDSCDDRQTLRAANIVRSRLLACRRPS